MAAATSKVARRRTDPGGRFIIASPARDRTFAALDRCGGARESFKSKISLIRAGSRHKRKAGHESAAIGSPGAPGCPARVVRRQVLREFVALIRCRRAELEPLIASALILRSAERAKEIRAILAGTVSHADGVLYCRARLESR